jgi:phosphomannomutase/phosphoglucomutase
MRELGCEVVPIYCEPDGTFPNHPARSQRAETWPSWPSWWCARAATWASVSTATATASASWTSAAAWSRRIPTCCSYTREALRQGPGKAVFERALLGIALRRRAQVRRHPRDGQVRQHPASCRVCTRSGPSSAAKLSGHIFFNDPPFEFDDALYAAALLLHYLDRDGRPLSEMLAELVEGLPHYVSSPELRVNCPDYLKADVVDAVREAFAGSHRVIDIDGARIYFGEKDWALIRPSNTSPKLSLRFEGVDAAAVARMKAELGAELGRHLPGFAGF